MKKTRLKVKHSVTARLQIRSVPVIVSFVWALVCPALWLNLDSGCVQKRLAFELQDWVKQIAIPNMGGHHPICPRGLSRTKWWKKGEFFSLPVRAETSVLSCPWTETYTISTLGSQACRLMLKLTPLVFLGLQFVDCKWWGCLASIIMWAYSL